MVKSVLEAFLVNIRYYQIAKIHNQSRHQLGYIFIT